MNNTLIKAAHTDGRGGTYLVDTSNPKESDDCLRYLRDCGWTVEIISNPVQVLSPGELSDLLEPRDE